MASDLVLRLAVRMHRPDFRATPGRFGRTTGNYEGFWYQYGSNASIVPTGKPVNRGFHRQI